MLKNLAKSAILTTVLGLGAPAIASAEELPAVNFKVIGMASSAVASTRDEGPFWGKTLPEASDGKVTAHYIPVDQTGVASGSLLRLLSLGGVDFIGIEISKLAGDDPQFEGCDIAGLTQDLDSAVKACSSYRETLDTIVQRDWNAKLLAIGYQPPQVLWCRTAISDLKGLSGKKVRVFNSTMSRLIESLGGTPVEIAFAEVVPALERGVVDCAITGTLTGNTARWPEVATHVIEMPMGWAVYAQLVNLDKWNALTPETRDFLTAQFDGFEGTMLATTQHSLDQAAICNYGLEGECTMGHKANMTQVAFNDEDRKAYFVALEDAVLPAWASRCGDACVTTWNETIGTALGLTMRASK